MSTSHDWARELQKTAEFLLSKEEVEIGEVPNVRFYEYGQKENFVKLVRALKPGKKTTNEYYIDFFPSGAEHLELSVTRDLMCKRLNPEYECTPLLSVEEDAEMEGQAV